MTVTCPQCGAEQPVAAEPSGDFASLAREKQPSLLSEFLYFLRENKAWWMVPILLALGLLTLFAYLTSTGAAPFIYPGL